MELDSSAINIAQVSGSLGDEMSGILRESDLTGYSMKPKYVTGNATFNIYIIISAALVFISIIALLDIVRLYMEYLTARDEASRSILRDRTIGQVYYAVIAIIITVITITILRYSNLI